MPAVNSKHARTMNETMKFFIQEILPLIVITVCTAAAVAIGVYLFLHPK